MPDSAVHGREPESDEIDSNAVAITKRNTETTRHEEWKTCRVYALEEKKVRQDAARWAHRHRVPIESLSNEHDLHKRLLTTWWDEHIAEHTKRVEMALHDMREKHKRTEKAMHQKLQSKARHATADKHNGTAGFFVGSSTLERMRFDLEIFRKNNHTEQIKRMARLVHGREVEEMEEVARRQAMSAQSKVRTVRRRNETTRLQLADKASLRWEQLVNIRDQELKTLQRKFQAAKDAVHRIESIEDKLQNQTMPVWPHMLESATRGTVNRAIDAGTFAIERISRKPNALGLKQIPKSKPQQQRPNSARPVPSKIETQSGIKHKTSNRNNARHVSRPGSAPARRSTPTTQTVPHAATICHFCGFLKANDECVSIPKSSSGRGKLGMYCSWECAKAWNHERSPMQVRWLRDLFIDELAKRPVEPTNKRYMDVGLVKEVNPFITRAKPKSAILEPDIDRFKMSNNKKIKKKKRKKKKKTKSLANEAA